MKVEQLNTPLLLERPGTSASELASRDHENSHARQIAARRLRSVTPYGLTAPAILVIGAMSLAPAVYGIWLSFTNWQFLTSASPHLQGVGAYRTVFGSAEFWSAFEHTWFWTFGTVIVEFVFGLPLSLLLSRTTKVSGFATGMLLLPWVTPFVVLAYAWLYLLDAGGPIHSLFQALGVGGQGSVLADPALALPIMTIISGWKGLPFMTVALLAARRSIDATQYEAADVDGANRWQKFRWITMPMLRNTTIVMSVVLGVFAFYSFDLVWLLTEGGPGTSSEISGVLIYQEFFVNGAPGVAAAMGIAIFVVLLVVAGAVVTLTVSRRREEV